MRNPKNSHELIRQNEQIVKKSQKHEANLQKNSTLYFQIGLIVCLLLAFGLLEMNFETAVQKEYATLIPDDDIVFIDVPLVKPQVPVFEEPVEQKKVLNSKTYTQEPDDAPEELFKEEFKEPAKENFIIDPDAIPTLEEKPSEPENVPFFAIQNAPIYPGCEGAENNAERKKCMSEKISKLIQRKFNGNDIATDYGLVGKQKIDVQFTIDKIGRVIDIKTRAPHPKLEKEAVRVIKFIPQMTPGRQRDKNVGVIYSLPIIFQAE